MTDTVPDRCFVKGLLPFFNIVKLFFILPIEQDAKYAVYCVVL